MRLLIVFTMVAVAGLAGCSSSDAGEKMTVVFEMTGTGTVTHLRYVDVGTERVVQIDEATTLPWRKEITGAKKDYIRLSAIPEGDVPATCKLTVDGKEVATDTDSGGVVECQVG